MKTLGISEFKAHALEILDRVSKTRESVVITKRGQPFAQVIPFSGPEDKPVPGKLSETLLFEKDIISPLGGSEWSACM